MHPTLTTNIDVALLSFWGFILFFVGLCVWLHREDRREGYPVEDDLTGRPFPLGGPLAMPSPKTFHLPFDHGEVTVPAPAPNAPSARDRTQLAARKLERFHGAPLVPTGDPLVDGIGPAAWVERAKRPDVDMDNKPRIHPLSQDPDFFIAREDPDLIGWPVFGTDKELAGTVTDLWIDRSDRMVRYLHVQLEGSGRGVLTPIMVAKVHRSRRRIVVDAITAAQFANVPQIEGDGIITRYEEDRVQAYYGGGHLYATRHRAEPII